jgi:hypothetical protein
VFLYYVGRFNGDVVLKGREMAVGWRVKIVPQLPDFIKKIPYRSCLAYLCMKAVEIR